MRRLSWARARLFDTARAAVYSPIQPKSLPAAALPTRARRNPEATAEPLRSVIRTVDAELRPTLVLALVGIYGVASFLVSQRAAEIGVRMAGAAGLMAIAATLAAVVPARRAASVDPATVLRS